MLKKAVLVGEIVLMILLTGCAGDSLLEPDPRCPFAERGGCHSVKEIHQMIDANQYTPDGNYVAKPQVVTRVIVQQKRMRVYIPSRDSFNSPQRGRVKIEQMTERLSQ